MLWFTSPTFAATAPELNIGQVINFGTSCKEGFFGFGLGHTHTTNDDAMGNDFVGVTISDGNGVPLHGMTFGLTTSGRIGTGWSLGRSPAVTGIPAINDITARPIHIRMYDINFGLPRTDPIGEFNVSAEAYSAVINSGAPLIAEATFDPGTTLPDGPTYCGDLPFGAGESESPPYIPGCPGDGTLNICITSSGNTDNIGSLDIWAVDESGNGYQAIFVSKDELDNLPDKPLTNTEIQSSPDGKITLYKLYTGEYQINIGPDKEGKVQVIIFTGIPPTNVYRRDFSIYELGSS